MRSIREVNEIGVRALVDALGKEDAQRFLLQLGNARRDSVSESTADESEAEELPPMTIEQAHEAIRDMQDPINQQHRL